MAVLSLLVFWHSKSTSIQGERMHIVILEGSPHKLGASNTIANAFASGAREKGHEVTILDLARMNLHPCLGCPQDTCYKNVCVQKDDWNILRDACLSCDMLVYATPIYFYGMCAQMKIAVDRSHCFHRALREKHIKSALIATACRTDDEVMSYVSHLYDGLARYMNYTVVATIYAKGVGYDGLASDSPYIAQACELGRSL